MLLTVTFNPAMDVYLRLSGLKTGEINRARRVLTEPGGKGVNIGYVLQRLGHEVATLGFVGGNTGLLVEERLRDYGLTTSFVHVDGETRRDYVLMDEASQSVTQVFESGPEIAPADLESLKARISRLLGTAEAVVLAGSLPPGTTPAWYREVVELVAQRGVPLALNVPGEVMQEMVEQPVWIAKPDVRVSHEFMGEWMLTEEGRLAALIRLREKARFAMVSVGFEAMLASSSEVVRVKAPACEVVSSIRAGDAILAGVVDSLLRGGTVADAARRGMAAAITSSCVLGGRFSSEGDVAAREEDMEVSAVEL